MPFSAADLVMEFKSLWKGTSGRTKKSAQALFDFTVDFERAESGKVIEKNRVLMTQWINQKPLLGQWLQVWRLFAILKQLLAQLQPHDVGLSKFIEPPRIGESKYKRRIQ